jgi:hypothetical protein
MGLDISPVDANGLARGIERMAQAPPAVAAYMKSLMTKH